jgi:serine phosphatase RsbU (regulator of sigma subunit)
VSTRRSSELPPKTVRPLSSTRNSIPLLGCLTYVNGAHCAPTLLRAAGDSKSARLHSCKIERLDTGGPVVGLIPDCAYEQADVILHPGDRLVIFTDGVSEAMNRAPRNGAKIA